MVTNFAPRARTLLPLFENENPARGIRRGTEIGSKMPVAASKKTLHVTLGQLVSEEAFSGGGFSWNIGTVLRCFRQKKSRSAHKSEYSASGGSKPFARLTFESISGCLVLGTPKAWTWPFL